MDYLDIYNLLLNKSDYTSRSIHYLKRYIKFIEMCELADSKNYERHHILPKGKNYFPEYKSFKDFPWNLKKLSFRQHYIAHKILAFALNKTMWSALRKMQYKNNELIVKNSRDFEMVKEKLKSYKGTSHHNYGRVHTDESKKKMSIARSGENNCMFGKIHPNRGKKIHSKEFIERMSQTGEAHPKYGKKESEYTRQKKSDSMTGLKKTKEHSEKIKNALLGVKHQLSICPHCGKEGGARHMKRWHFNNCKSLLLT